MPHRPIPSLLLASLLWLTTSVAAQMNEPARLLRYADIHGDQVAFVHAGNLYHAQLSNNQGQARRLTSHHGSELFPKFSPDGSMIAFSAEYSGNRQVYMMPVSGGMPTQLTYYNDVGAMAPRGGYDYRILDWTPDGENVLVRANRLPWGQRMGRPYLVPVNGGLEQPLAIPEGGAGMLSPDGTKMVYTPIDREFRTWKRYRGGRAQDVWIYDLEANTSERLTTHDGTDHQPLWVGENIYFTSDRDYTLNLFRYQQDGNHQKLTSHDGFDVLWASAGPNEIVYEAGGALYRYVPGSAGSTRLDIMIEDDYPEARARFVNLADQVESMDLSPDGKRAVFGARGEVFSVPAEDGVIRALSKTPAAREISVSWSPDGRSIAYLSDATGEYELYVQDQMGSEPARQVTTDGGIWRFDPIWSPDSSMMAYADKNQQLTIVTLNNGKSTRVDRSDYNDITDFSWSPDSGWLAYTKTNEASIDSIWMYGVDSKRSRQLTSDQSGESEPVFDPKGRYLYFTSNRDYNLTFSSYEFNYLYTDATRVYAGLLTNETEGLFLPKSDEVAIEAESDDKGDKDEEKPADKVIVSIDFGGFDQRIQPLMQQGGSYAGISANDDAVFYVKFGDGPNELMRFDLADEEEASVVTGVQGYTLSANGQKLLISSGDGYAIIDAKADQKLDDHMLDLSNMTVKIDPMVEWRQMYTDGWRILRDWFYDPGMHGNDWQAVHDKYLPLVAHVRHRQDLDYLFGEIAGEMNAGHIYVQSGDQISVDRVEGGLLGADLTPHSSGYVQISSIMDGENWHQNTVSPLTVPGVNVAEGEYLIAINGRSVTDVSNVYELLENTAGKQTLLTVNDSPRPSGARDVTVTPIASEIPLRYLTWVNERKRMVDELSGGRIGYIHLPNTAGPGNRELNKDFAPQVHKDALIFDARYNGGGFIPDRMIEIVSRTPLNYWKRRGLKPLPTPTVAHVGPKATLINHYSSSGGDAFPYYFKKLGLGSLIGTRTWGGLIGISGNPSMADGGSILASTFRFMDTDGNWAVENEGVAPDIEVWDRPELVAAGKDPTLERAVAHLLEQLEQQVDEDMVAPPAPTEF